MFCAYSTSTVTSGRYVFRQHAMSFSGVTHFVDMQCPLVEFMCLSVTRRESHLLSPSLTSLMVSVDVKQHVYFLTYFALKKKKEICRT